MILRRPPLLISFQLTFLVLADYFPDCTWSQRVDLYLSGAFKPNSLSNHDETQGEGNHFFTLFFMSFSICTPPLSAFKDCWPFRSRDRGSPSPNNMHHNDTDALCQSQLSAFMERARSQVVNKVFVECGLWCCCGGQNSMVY